MQTAVTADLESRGIPFRTFTHPGPVQSLEQAARERGQEPDQVIRSILFRISREEFVMVLAAGDRQIDWRTLRRHLGESRITMASQEEVLQETGYAIGAVSPFGLPRPIRLLIDQSVYDQVGEVSIGAGQRGSTVILQVEDLKRALGSVETGQFVKRNIPG
ncbi:MAG: YbaK/EbsC family protein [Anaerolineales bacterium]|nr:YbaK/EbsC family protein [Anaerolineales bacterium]